MVFLPPFIAEFQIVSIGSLSNFLLRSFSKLRLAGDTLAEDWLGWILLSMHKKYTKMVSFYHFDVYLSLVCIFIILESRIFYCPCHLYCGGRERVRMKTWTCQIKWSWPGERDVHFCNPR